MSKSLCPGSKQRIYDAEQHPHLTWGEARDGVLPTGMKRRRITCRLCGRRMTAALRVCADGCCLYHVVPPHKPRGWWRKPSPPRKQRRVTRPRRGRQK